MASGIVKTEALRYAGLGISVIPVKADKTPLTYTSRGRLLPGGSWDFAQNEAADPQTVGAWYDAAPGAGVAIVCGRVSGNLVVLDIDDAELCQFIFERGTRLLQSTWTVRSGSGKLHIYIRSAREVLSAGISMGKRHLADIRADGKPPYKASYVLAPPSPYDSKGIVGAYRTIHRGPDQVLSVEDGASWMRQFIQLAYSKMTGTDRALVTTKTYEESLPTSIKEPIDEVDVKEMLDQARVSGKIQRAVLNGAEPGEGDWEKASSYSHIDHAVVFALKEANLSNDNIETIFASTPIGENCYRNTERPNHGRRYLQYSMDKADAKMAQTKDAATAATGKNFEVMKVVRVLYEPPVWEIHIRTDTGETGIVKADANTLSSEKQFLVACLRDMNMVPQLTDAHRAQGFLSFTQALTALSTSEEPPKDATDQGVLVGRILHILKNELDADKPDDESAAVLGWRNNKEGTAYFRGDALQQRLAHMMRQVPAPGKVWDVLRAFGGMSVAIKTSNGRVLRMWKMNLLPIDKA